MGAKVLNHTLKSDSKLTLLESRVGGIQTCMVNPPLYAFNTFRYQSNQTNFLIPSGISLKEGDIIHSQPPGVILKLNHGQLVIYEKDHDDSESPWNILWQTQPYLDDGSQIYSSLTFQNDCNIMIYSDTVQLREDICQEESALWQSITNTDWSNDCFLAWDPEHKKLFVQENNFTEKIMFVDNGWTPRNLTDAQNDEMYLILPAWTKVMQGFMIESEPPGFVLQHKRGELYLYDDNSANNSSEASLLWHSEDVWISSRDVNGSDMSWSILRDMTLFIESPHINKEVPWSNTSVLSSLTNPWLWRTTPFDYDNGENNCFADDCFLAWIPAEERLAIYKGLIDSPGEEVWTSKDFSWEPAHADRSEFEQTAATALTRFSSIISMIGSGLIMGIILSKWTHKRKTVNTRDRLLFSMSILDFLSSVAHCLGVIPMPSNTFGIMGAAGTQATCTAQGFFIQLGFAVPLYNCMVCLYVLSVVRFKCKERFISTRMEPVMHTVVWGYALGTGLIGVFLKLYNSNGSFCWVEQFPHDCSDIDHIECTRGKQAFLYKWIFAGVTLLLSLSVIVASMAWLYYYISQNKLKLIKRYGPSAAANNGQLIEVRKQALLYVAAFLITFYWPMSLSIKRHFEVRPAVWELACFSFFFPMQGFWNFAIFIRPAFNRTRRQNALRCFLWILKTAVLKEAGRGKRRQPPQYGEGGQDGDQRRRSSLFKTPWLSYSAKLFGQNGEARQERNQRRRSSLFQNTWVNNFSGANEPSPPLCNVTNHGPDITNEDDENKCLVINEHEEYDFQQAREVESDKAVTSNDDIHTKLEQGQSSVPINEVIEEGTFPNPSRRTSCRRGLEKLQMMQSKTVDDCTKKQFSNNRRQRTSFQLHTDNDNIFSNTSQRRTSRRRDLDIDVDEIQIMDSNNATFPRRRRISLPNNAIKSSLFSKPSRRASCRRDLDINIAEVQQSMESKSDGNFINRRRHSVRPRFDIDTKELEMSPISEDWRAACLELTGGSHQPTDVDDPQMVKKTKIDDAVCYEVRNQSRKNLKRCDYEANESLQRFGDEESIVQESSVSRTNDNDYYDIENVKNEVQGFEREADAIIQSFRDIDPVIQKSSIHETIGDDDDYEVKNSTLRGLQFFRDEASSLTQQISPDETSGGEDFDIKNVNNGIELFDYESGAILKSFRDEEEPVIDHNFSSNDETNNDNINYGIEDVKYDLQRLDDKAEAIMQSFRDGEESQQQQQQQSGPQTNTYESIRKSRIMDKASSSGDDEMEKELMRLDSVIDDLRNELEEKMY